jgi:hypothetical protein
LDGDIYSLAFWGHTLPESGGLAKLRALRATVALILWGSGAGEAMPDLATGFAGVMSAAVAR